MTLPNGAPARDLASENEALALRWAGPFGWAVLQVLRRTDAFAEADFADFVRRAPRREVTDPPPLPDGTPVLRQVTYEPEPPSTVTATPSLEPAPPADFYRRATRAVPTEGRPGEPPPPPGRRDASGRYVRPAR